MRLFGKKKINFGLARRSWIYKNIDNFLISQTGFRYSSITFRQDKKEACNVSDGFLYDVYRMSFTEAFIVGWRIKCLKNKNYCFFYQTHEDKRREIEKEITGR